LTSRINEPLPYHAKSHVFERQAPPSSVTSLWTDINRLHTLKRRVQKTSTQTQRRYERLAKLAVTSHFSQAVTSDMSGFFRRERGSQDTEIGYTLFTRHNSQITTLQSAWQ